MSGDELELAQCEIEALRDEVAARRAEVERLTGEVDAMRSRAIYWADEAEKRWAVVEAAKPFASGGEWGKWKAWIVEGGPLRAPGIEAARAITGWQVKLDAALHRAEGAARPASANESNPAAPHREESRGRGASASPQADALPPCPCCRMSVLGAVPCTCGCDTDPRAVGCTYCHHEHAKFDAADARASDRTEA